MDAVEDGCENKMVDMNECELKETWMDVEQNGWQANMDKTNKQITINWTINQLNSQQTGLGDQVSFYNQQNPILAYKHWDFVESLFVYQLCNIFYTY